MDEESDKSVDLSKLDTIREAEDENRDTMKDPLPDIPNKPVIKPVVKKPPPKGKAPDPAQKRLSNMEMLA